MAVFDLDGTLLNTLEDLADAVNYSLAQFGMPQRTIEEVRNYVGNGIRLLIERSVPNGTDLPVIDNVFECFKKYYQEHCNDKTKAYDGIIDMLKELKQSGIKLAVLSNKAQNAVTKLCDIYFDNLLDITFGAREGIAKSLPGCLVRMCCNSRHCIRRYSLYWRFRCRCANSTKCRG